MPISSKGSYKPVSQPTRIPDFNALDQHEEEELSSWPPEQHLTVEQRNNYINIQRKPGFIKRILLMSVGLNAVLLVVVAAGALKFLRFVFVSAPSPLTSSTHGSLLKICPPRNLMSRLKADYMALSIQARSNV